MNIYENNKQLLTAIGGADNYSTDFEVRKAILDLLGGDSSDCNSIYEVDKQILNIYLEGGGAGGDITLKPITITENGVYTAGAGNGYNEVTVNVEIPECPEIPLTSITINSNGTYIPEEGGYNEVIVDVAGCGTGSSEKIKVKKIEVSNDCIVDGYWPAENIDTSNMNDMYGMFYGCSSLQTLDVSGLDTNNVKSMGSMFKGCSSLQTLDVSGFDTSNVTNMSSMFYGCSSLQTLDVSGCDTSNVTNMDSMFKGCSSLQSVGDLSGWNTSNVNYISELFIGCGSITQLDVSGWDASNVKNNIYAMFGEYNSNISNLVGGKTLDEVITNNIGILNGVKANLTVNGGTVGRDGFLPDVIDSASIRALMNGIADLTGQTSKTIHLSNTVKAKLTEEDIAIATAKNWTIS